MEKQPDKQSFLDTLVIFFGEVTDTFADSLTGDILVYLVIGILLLFFLFKP